MPQLDVTLFASLLSALLLLSALATVGSSGTLALSYLAFRSRRLLGSSSGNPLGGWPVSGPDESPAPKHSANPTAPWPKIGKGGVPTRGLATSPRNRANRAKRKRRPSKWPLILLVWLLRLLGLALALALFLWLVAVRVSLGAGFGRRRGSGPGPSGPTFTGPPVT